MAEEARALPQTGNDFVIDRRMETLYDAIKVREWGAVEFAFDQVRRAIDKSRRERKP